ncbi:MAG: dynamin family protein [Gammaproteobacteria bacterium]
MLISSTPLEQRIKKLQQHLARENPILLDVVKSFRQLDRVAYRMGCLSRDDSFATKVPWLPMISVLGTFSSGKSTFINGYLGAKLQATGNQAVDDKFTVMCFGGEDSDRVLPGRALDADPRFPFYQISQAIDEAVPGEGQRIDTYLQLKTCNSAKLRGKILIDSPGFDADEQRNSTLRITDHIIDLSDLVLIFFDARHPEPGAMQDTLKHLVASTLSRSDSNKFLYVLNQIDNAAREDNPEEVFGAWQRALAQYGLTSGRFYTLYDATAAIDIPDSRLRQRFERKRDHDLDEIDRRIRQVEVERAYRIIGVLEQTAKSLQERMVPAVREARTRWRRWVFGLDAALFVALAVGFALWSIMAGHWSGPGFMHPWYLALEGNVVAKVLIAALLVLGAIYTHFKIRKLVAGRIAARLKRDRSLEDVSEWTANAFSYNVKAWQIALPREPAGWNRVARRRIERVLADAERYVQALNNRFADPAGAATARTPALEESAAPTVSRPAAGDGKPLRPDGTWAGAVKENKPAALAPPADYIADDGEPVRDGAGTDRRH